MPSAVLIITADAKMYIPMDELVDFKEEIARLERERAKAQKELDFINSKLNNPGFVSKAPEKVVQGQREAAEKLTDKIAMLDDSIAGLQ
ncbi:Valine--tRNA ligase [bioreactor metagenome]|uniref:valine--tRNA ligase n=1 Tax=bioreactor metagenome TaxID=1076179 RepID=A0A645HTZ6_9ZZZZ